tara:strand:- start:68539 stop:69009 length:471 start_codon:yes stop_codon:yes gene_type:complete
MKNFSSLIKESKSIFHLCDEYDKEIKVANDLVNSLNNKHKDLLLKMVNNLLNAWREVYGDKNIIIEEFGKEVEYLWEDTYLELDDNEYGVKHIVVSKIYNNGNIWMIYGWINGDYESWEDIGGLPVSSLSQFLRSLLETKPIMGCYALKGVKNINK